MSDSGAVGDQLSAAEGRRRDSEKTITKMDTDTAVPVPKLFMPHPNLSDEVNRNIAQSEIEGGCAWTISDGKTNELGRPDFQTLQRHWMDQRKLGSELIG